MKKVFIDGVHGIAGERLQEQLSHLSLPYEYYSLSADDRHDAQKRYQAIKDADIAVLCVPDEVARCTMRDLHDVDIIIIDVSTAHRTSEGWTYGYRELHPDQDTRIRSSKRISNPGCFANGILAIVAPLHNILTDMPIALAGATGYSAGGKKAMQRQQESPIGLRITNADNEHVHLKEVRHWLELKQPIAFIPSVAHFEAGQIVWTTLFQQGCSIPVSDVFAHYRDYYKEYPTIHVNAVSCKNIIPEQYAGTQEMTILIHEENDYVTLYAVYDNLGRGSVGSLVNILTLLSS